jgi:hypothetical protein
MPRESSDYSEELVFRRGKLRKRDDYSVDLFRQALAVLAEPDAHAIRERLRPLLTELSRFYDPVSNGPVLDPATRRQVLDLVEAGSGDRARQVLEERLRSYTRLDRPAGGPGGPAGGV